MRDETRLIADWLAEARRAVAFTGAGISTESGIPDFRSPNGVWARTQPVYYQEFLRSPEARLEYWRQKAESHRTMYHAAPNDGHRALARLEDRGRLRGVITQNIDGLHQAAGSRAVLELHGTARLVGCLKCGALFDADAMVAAFEREERVPDCPDCGGLLKHATVSFGQSLPEGVLTQATDWAGESDLLLAVGSSLVVMPAADLPRIAKRHGARLVIINGEPTPLDEMADLVLRAPIGETFAAIEAAMGTPAPPAS